MLRQWSHPSFKLAAVNNDVAVLTLDASVAGKTLPITSMSAGGNFGGTATITFGMAVMTTTTGLQGGA